MFHRFFRWKTTVFVNMSKIRVVSFTQWNVSSWQKIRKTLRTKTHISGQCNSWESNFWPIQYYPYNHCSSSKVCWSSICFAKNILKFFFWLQVTHGYTSMFLGQSSISNARTTRVLSRQWLAGNFHWNAPRNGARVAMKNLGFSWDAMGLFMGVFHGIFHGCHVQWDFFVYLIGLLLILW